MSVLLSAKRKAFARLFAFLFPVLLMSVLFIIRKIAPFGEMSLAAIDGYGQYFPMLREAERHFFSPHVFSFSGGLGFSFPAESAYYTNSPLNALIFLLPCPVTVWEMDLLILFRFGLMSLSMYLLLSGHYRREEPGFLVLSAAYALSSYTISFINQIMWMDALILLPILILSLERIRSSLVCREKRALFAHSALYTLFLFLLIISCFYTAYMVCIFLCLYFLYLDLKEKTENYRILLHFFLFFAGASLLSGLLSLPVLLPLFSAIRRTIAAGKEADIGFYFLHGFGTFFRNMLPCQQPSRVYGAPNMYFGLFSLVLLGLSCFSPELSVRKKIAAAVFLFGLLASMNLSVCNYVWHGFHEPAQLPGRESFLFIFLVLFFSGSGMILIKSPVKKSIICMLLALEITANILFSAQFVPCVSARRVSYMDQIIDAERERLTPDFSKGEFFRTELLSYRDNGGQLYGYPGISFYSSLMSGDAYRFFTRLGVGIYAKNVSVRLEDPESQPLLLDLFSVRFLVSDDGTVRENPDALPLLFAASPAILGKPGDPFPAETGYKLQNSLFQALSDTDREIVTKDGIVREKTLQEAYRRIAEYGSVHIDSIREKPLETVIDAVCEIEKDGMILSGLPAESVKSAELDGEKVPVHAVLGFLAAFSVHEGAHRLTIRLGIQ